MKELLFYILILILGMIIFTSALVIAVCASMLVMIADNQITAIINGRPS